MNFNNQPRKSTDENLWGDSAARKAQRMNSGLPDALSTNTYNLIIGGVLLYGFIVNALIVGFLGNLFTAIASQYFFVIILGYFVLAFTGNYIAGRSHNPAISFLGYNLVVLPIGILLSITLNSYATSVVLLAVILTGIVVLTITAIATAFPMIFAKMGGALSISLSIALVVQVVASLLGFYGNAISWIFVIIFALYLGYDLQRAQMYPKTLDNAIDSALDLYLDIINIFLRLLRVLGRGRRR